LLARENHRGFCWRGFPRDLFPDFLEIFRDVFEVRITGAVGVGCQEGKLDKKRKRGDLPGVVGQELGVKLSGFFGGVRVEDGLLPGALAEAGLAGSFFVAGRVELLLAQFCLAGRASQKNSGEMLDAGLAGVGRLGGGNGIGDVADEANVLFAGGFGDGEIGFGLEAGLHFDEVDAFGFQFADGGIGFGGGLHNDRRLKGRRVAVEVGAGEEDLRAELSAGVDFVF